MKSEISESERLKSEIEEVRYLLKLCGSNPFMKESYQSRIDILEEKLSIQARLEECRRKGDIAWKDVNDINGWVAEQRGGDHAE